MVVFILYVKADLEGIDTLKINPEANLCFSVRNPLDKAETREKIVVDPSVLHINSALATHEKHRDETPYHFAMKWRDATSRSTLRILGTDQEVVEDVENENDKRTTPNKHKKSNKMTSELEKALERVRDIRGEDSGNLVPVLALDCNGLEPYAFHPLGEEFAVVGKRGQQYDTVDVASDGGDWAEYDEATGSVSITNLTSEIQ